MEKSLTADELLDKKYPKFEDLDRGNIWANIEETMIEFAKLHVEAALKAASESRCINMFDKPWKAYSLEPGTKILDVVNITVNKNLIINSYPLENIK
jgi:hypothetical protein